MCIGIDARAIHRFQPRVGDLLAARQFHLQSDNLAALIRRWVEHGDEDVAIVRRSGVDLADQVLEGAIGNALAHFLCLREAVQRIRCNLRYADAVCGIVGMTLQQRFPGQAKDIARIDRAAHRAERGKRFGRVYQ